MKRVLMLLVLLSLPTLAFAEGTLRTWRSKTGVAMIEAAWDSQNDLDEKFVFLLKGDRRYRIPFENLSEEDQKYVSDGRTKRWEGFGLIDVTHETPQTTAPTPVSEGRAAGERMVRTINGVEYAFRWCPAGSFVMGSPADEKGRYADEIQHHVTLTKGFWMLETEVTHAMWKSVMSESFEKKAEFYIPNFPMKEISWSECQEFCQKLRAQGLNVQFPTEAQWEYACRAGTTGAYAGDLNSMGWHWGNSDAESPVAQKEPNPWGLYDMHGNLWEWCADWHGPYSNDSATDPAGPESGSGRVHRGGCFEQYEESCRSAWRDSKPPLFYSCGTGFRPILVP
ncbi:MAG: formylglycine-generating enzyme family protein [Planctomycetia bacterium]|nr:formylglycine-generating enzyme family protein [Planctomycetia bacterium]